MATSLIQAMRQMDDHRWGSPPIIMYINSPGGEVIATNAIVDCMQRLDAPVVTIVEGYAASAAAVIAACGEPGGRLITPSSMMMIHELSSLCWGRMTEIEDQMVLLDKLMNSMIRKLSKATGRRRDSVRKDLRRDLWFDADEAMAYGKKGLVDKVLG